MWVQTITTCGEPPAIVPSLHSARGGVIPEQVYHRFWPTSHTQLMEVYEGGNPRGGLRCQVAEDVWRPLWFDREQHKVGGNFLECGVKKDDNSGSAASVWILYLKRKKCCCGNAMLKLVENSLVDPPHPNGAFPYTCQPGWTRRDLHYIWRCVFKWRTCVTCSVSQQRADWGRDLKERL